VKTDPVKTLVTVPAEADVENECDEKPGPTDEDLRDAALEDKYDFIKEGR